MQAFVWSDRFATGIESVDVQHRQLVALVNRLGDLRMHNATPDEASLQATFKELADYARFHFTDEERVMTEGGLAAAQIQLHHKHHQSFTEQVVAMWQGRGSMTDPLQTLHGFLTAWLTYHILGEDQTMARELVRIKAGTSAADAHELETSQAESSTSALLGALQQLYSVLSQQNRDLANLNLGLEARIAERTADLAAANEKLNAEQIELVALLGRIEQTQSQLRQSEKMASIGQLAAGVAHEINNPVGFVSSNLGTLGRYAKVLLQVIDAGADDPRIQKAAAELELSFIREDMQSLLDESHDGLERVRKIVANLKDFSHVDQAEWQEADLLAGLESTLSVVWHELKYKATIIRELQPLPLVRCMPAQINQVLMNLLINAAQALPERGDITLRSGVEGEEVWLEVADTGRGMSAETQRRMFEPFYTTKPVGQGTGLGMSLSWDIITKHGGRFDVDSTLGQGSRVRFFLPIAGTQATTTS
jgi:two-component system NtrC family sensor kinase